MKCPVMVIHHANKVIHTESIAIIINICKNIEKFLMEEKYESLQ